MKNFVFDLLPAVPHTFFAQTAKIKIDIVRTIGEIDPMICGAFMEPIHFTGIRSGLPDAVHFKTLNGNLYDTSYPHADEDGVRKDYNDVMIELKNYQYSLARR